MITILGLIMVIRFKETLFSFISKLKRLRIHPSDTQSVIKLKALALLF
jgi:hypothetical protein